MTVIVNDDKVDELAAFCKRMWLIDAGEVKIDEAPIDFFSHREDLSKAMIRVPPVTAVAYELALRKMWDGPLPITVEQFVDVWQKPIQPD